MEEIRGITDAIKQSSQQEVSVGKAQEAQKGMQNSVKKTPEIESSKITSPQVPSTSKSESFFHLLILLVRF